MVEERIKYTTSFIYLEKDEKYVAIESIELFRRNGNDTDIFFWKGGWYSVFDPEKNLWFDLVQAKKKLNNQK